MTFTHTLLLLILRPLFHRSIEIENESYQTHRIGTHDYNKLSVSSRYIFRTLDDYVDTIRRPRARMLRDMRNERKLNEAATKLN